MYFFITMSLPYFYVYVLTCDRPSSIETGNKGLYMQRASDYSRDDQRVHSSQTTHVIIDAESLVSPLETKDAVVHTTWLQALKNVLPLYIVIHVLFFLLSYLASLFIIGNYSPTPLPLSMLVLEWNRWDTGHFTAIATNGYDAAWRTAFFPLFPLLERGGAFLTGGPFRAGLIISNLAELILLVVLYRLVWEDFDQEHAFRTTLYLAVFPTAFFFVAAYNESLFLCLTLLSFYYMRRGRWWVAGLFGLLASLTRSAGPLLLLPFVYEYLRQHSFKLKAIRFDVVSGALIPAGLGLFALYCYERFHDVLAFSHAQKIAWNREFHGPWHGLIDSFLTIVRGGLHAALSFVTIHTVIDLSAGLLMLVLVVLGFIGPWKFSSDKRSYALYAAVVYLFSLMFPLAGGDMLGALSRYVLEIFPVFIVLAMMVKQQQTNLYYVMLSVSMLAFLLLQFLTGHWVI